MRRRIKHAVYSFIQDVMGNESAGADIEYQNENSTDNAVDQIIINCGGACNFPDNTNSLLMHDTTSHSQQESV